jgi:tRNA(His) 5'-end guanylyltransferase
MHNIEERMKMYEQAARTMLPRRMPVIIRVDGKNFSRYTRNLPGKPFDRNFVSVMESVAISLCQEIQGAQMAYVQSDEVSVLVHGYKKFESEPWFQNQTQKIVSVAAAIAAATFTANSWRMWAPPGYGEVSPGPVVLLGDCIEPAYFDARAFVLPESDVNNYFLWRQRDAIRNSIQMFTSSHFSHKDLQNKSTNEMIKMCESKGHDWRKLSPSLRNGRCVSRHHEIVDGVERSHFRVDTNVPLFREQPNYVMQHLQSEK